MIRKHEIPSSGRFEGCGREIALPNATGRDGLHLGIERSEGALIAQPARIVERGHVALLLAVVNSPTLNPILQARTRAGSMLMTDEATYYRSIGREFKYHFTVQHGVGEHVRGGAHTNTIEGYFSIFKRGVTGVYQHCSSRHLKRYLAEFDFRYNQRVALGIADMERTDRALFGILGKRRTCRGPSAS